MTAETVSPERSWLYHPVFPESWEPHVLYSLAAWINGMAFKDINFTPTGRPVIKIAEIKGGITAQTQFTDSEYDERYFITRGDMLFSWSGQPETSIDAFYWDGPDGWLNQHVFKVLPDDDACTPSFLYYILKYLKPNFIGIARNKQTTGLGHVTKADMQAIHVRIPDRPTQDRITHVLSKLDARIDVNRRMNRTLEKTAAALFKSWFIDFDPVHAKLALSNAEGAEGRDPGLPAEIADLFPDSFEYSPIGPIPKGWTVGPLAEIASLRTRTIQPGKQPDVRWEHYSIPAYDEGQQPKRELGETIKSGKYAVPQGSVLVSKLNPQFPRIWLPWVSDAALAICSTEFMPFVPQHADWRPFLYEMMTSRPLQEAIKAHVTGSTGSRQRAKPSEIAELTVLVPPSDAIAGFSHLVAPLHNRLMLNRRQNRRLAGLRDTLLPKLMSGEIEVCDFVIIGKEVEA